MNELVVRLGLENSDNGIGIDQVQKAYKYPTAKNLKCVPKKDQTEDLVKHVCSHDGLALRYVAKKLVTIDLCEIAVTQNGLSLQYVPQNLKPRRLCDIAVSNNGRALEYVPEWKVSLELSQKAVSYYLNIPYQSYYETWEDYQKKCERHIADSQKHGCGLGEYQKYPIAFVPNEFLTKELLEKCVRYSPLSLRDVPSKKKTKELVKLAVSLNGLALKYVPPRWYTEEMVAIALENNSLAIKYVPANYITQELCDRLFDTDYRTFPYFPENFVTFEMCLKIIGQKQFSVMNLSIAELIELYGETDIELITFSDIPENIRNNKEFLDRVMNLYTYKALPILNWNQEITESREIRKSSLFEMPRNKRGAEIFPLTEEVVEYLNANALYPEEKQDSSIRIKFDRSKQYIDNKDSFVVPIKPLVSKELPAVPVDRNIIVRNLSDDENIKNIYYISDVHVEFQLYGIANQILKKKREIEVSLEVDFNAIVEKLLDEKIDELIANRSGILLVCGDVADSTELFHMFYEKLSSKWKGRIICILGNHELWDGTTPTEWNDSGYTAREVEEIILDYKESLDTCYNCTLLENELFIMYKGQNESIICEEDILNASLEDLREVLEKSSLIILGGIGYSGLNVRYNSKAGLYRKTITSFAEDKRRSKKFFQIYEKIKKCACDKRVIVMTHTPVYDWSNERCNPNWIYVNGHTHRNTIQKDENGAMIISDNQVGYEPCKWKLNAFSIGALWYDPFSSYKDGIYKITSDEYGEFYRGRGMYNIKCKYSGTLYAVKRNKMYMFLLESPNSLCLMEGGRRKKLEKHDIQYYYNNMQKYGQLVLKIIEPYRQIMQRLSDEVKKIGGIGTIHGCIIDITYLSHIYVNPMDGKITCYWAFDMSSREVYDNIQLLVEQRESHLVNQFMIEMGNHALPMMEKYLTTVNSCSDIAKLPCWVWDKEIYKPSAALRSLQYVWEENVIRVWNDNVLNCTNNRLNQGNILPPSSVPSDSRFMESKEEYL